MNLEKIIWIFLNLPRIIRGIIQLIVGIIIEGVVWYSKFQIENALTQVIWEINPLVGIMISLLGLVSLIKGILLIYIEFAE